MFATNETVDLAEWIIDDTCLVYFTTFKWRTQVNFKALLRAQFYQKYWKLQFLWCSTNIFGCVSIKFLLKRKL